MGSLRSGVVVALLALARAAVAQPIAVLPSRVPGERVTSPDIAPNTAPDMQGDRYEGESLRALIETRLSEPAPTPSPRELAETEDLVRRGSAAFFGSRFDEATRMLLDAAETLRGWLDAAGDGVDLDRIRGLFIRARVLASNTFWALGNVARGRALLGEIALLAPDWEPSDAEYAPTVNERLHQVRDEMLAHGAATIEVDLTVRGCEIQLDTRVVLTTPLVGPMPSPVRIDSLLPGTHWVHVRCGSGTRRYRRHVLNLAARQTARVSIDPDLDAVLVTRPAPALEFESAGARTAHQVRLARLLGRSLELGRVMLIQPDGLVLRVDVQPDVGLADPGLRGPTWPTWLAGGFGLAGTGLGVVLFAVSGFCERTGPMGECSASTNYYAPGAVALGVGLAALIGAAIYHFVLR